MAALKCNTLLDPQACSNFSHCQRHYPKVFFSVAGFLPYGQDNVYSGGPWGIRTPDILFRRQTLYPAELRDQIRNGAVGEDWTLDLFITNEVLLPLSYNSIITLDAPLGLEPRLTESKSALLPLEEGATSKQVLLYMLCQTLSNILDARLGLEPRTYWVRVSRSTNWSIGQYIIYY